MKRKGLQQQQQCEQEGTHEFHGMDPPCVVSVECANHSVCPVCDVTHPLMGERRRCASTRQMVMVRQDSTEITVNFLIVNNKVDGCAEYRLIFAPVRDRDDILTMLSNQIPHPIARDVISSSDTSPYHLSYDSWTPIMFMDICRSTHFAQHHTPQETAQMHMTVFQAVDRVISAFGHRVHKLELVGDACVVISKNSTDPSLSPILCGSDVCDEHLGQHEVCRKEKCEAFQRRVTRTKDCQAMGRFATTVMNEIRSLPIMRASGGDDLNIRIGLNCGDVHQTVFERKLSLHPYGAAMPATARLESHADPGTILTTTDFIMRIEDPEMGISQQCFMESTEEPHHDSMMTSPSTTDSSLSSAVTSALDGCGSVDRVWEVTAKGLPPIRVATIVSNDDGDEEEGGWDAEEDEEFSLRSTSSSRIENGEDDDGDDVMATLMKTHKSSVEESMDLSPPARPDVAPMVKNKRRTRRITTFELADVKNQMFAIREELSRGSSAVTSGSEAIPTSPAGNSGFHGPLPSSLEMLPLLLASRTGDPLPPLDIPPWRLNGSRPVNPTEQRRSESGKPDGKKWGLLRKSMRETMRRMANDEGGNQKVSAGERVERIYNQPDSSDRLLVEDI